MYDSKKHTRQKTRKAVLDELSEREIEDNLDDYTDEETCTSKCAEIKLIDGKNRKTEKKKTDMYDIQNKKDPENFYREILLLFYPWYQGVSDI